MLDSARRHYDQQRRVSTSAVLESRRRRKGGGNAVAQVIARYQAAAIVLADRAVGEMLSEQGIPDEPVAALEPAAFVTPQRSLASMVEAAASDEAIDRIVGTLVSDAGRSAQGVAQATRPAVTAHVRYLNPPSCARCAILAGRIYRWSEGFQRHPRCDCQMIPSTQRAAQGLVGDPMEAFRKRQIVGLSEADTVAIGEGADIAQVVNIRRKSAGLVRGSSVLTRGGRLTPEGIYSRASGRDEALDLLRQNGYILDRPVRAAVAAAPAPLRWQAMKPDEVAAVFGGGPLGTKAAAKVKAAYMSGNKMVSTEVKLTDAEMQTLLSDLEMILAKLPEHLQSRAFGVHVPAGDATFRAPSLKQSTKRGTVGAYVLRGGTRVQLNPRVAKGLTSQTSGAWHMPAGANFTHQQYTLAHEIGHIIDGSHQHTMLQPPGKKQFATRRDQMKYWHDHADELSTYGRANLHEGYAEAFAQWVLGGPGSSRVADEYARRYGWRR